MRKSLLLITLSTLLCLSLSSCFDDAGTKSFLFGKNSHQQKVA